MLSSSSSSLLRRAPPAISFFTTGPPAYRPYSSHSRPPSSAQPTSSTVVPSTSSIASHPLPDDVNPPPSTRPADLTLPSPLESSAAAADKAKRLIALGRAYLSFYKTGLKNVYHNYRASIPIRQSFNLPAYLPSSPSALSSPHKPPAISRANFQLLHRAAHDVRRMIPFSIMLIVCGEMTPLVVLALGNAVTPFTCRIPTQLAKSRRLRALRKAAALRAHRAATAGSVSPVTPGSDPELRILHREFANPAWIAAASAAEILRACAALGLARSHTHPEPVVSLLRYRARLAARAEYIARDDALIRDGGGVAALDAAEVSIAVDERGGVDVAADLSGWEAERAERRWLQRWLRQE